MTIHPGNRPISNLTHSCTAKPSNDAIRGGIDTTIQRFWLRIRRIPIRARMATILSCTGAAPTRGASPTGTFTNYNIS